MIPKSDGSMSFELSSPVGLVAGNGNFPIEFANNAKARGLSVVAVAHRDETKSELANLVDECLWIKIGQLNKLIKFFEKKKVRQVALVGGIRRAGILRRVKLDWLGLKLLARLGTVRDDALLRGIAEEIERSGIEVISANVLLERSVPGPGLLSERMPSPEELRQALIGWDVAESIGQLDIGQTVIVNQGVVVSVEAIEGTDAAILRGGELSGKGAVVVKLPKPHQDLRFDLPAVGPKTMEIMGQVGATVLVVLGGQTIFLDPELMAREANRLGITCLLVRDRAELEGLLRGLEKKGAKAG